MRCRTFTMRNEIHLAFLLIFLHYEKRAYQEPSMHHHADQKRTTSYLLPIDRKDVPFHTT